MCNNSFLSYLISCSMSINILYNNTVILLLWLPYLHCVSFLNRNLSHRITEADSRAVRPRWVPGKQCGGYQCSTHHRWAAGGQTAVLPKPVTHGNWSTTPGEITHSKSFLSVMLSIYFLSGHLQCLLRERSDEVHLTEHTEHVGPAWSLHRAVIPESM